MSKVFQVQARIRGDGLKVGAPDDMTEDQIRALAEQPHFRDRLLERLEIVATDIGDDSQILDLSECWWLVDDGGESLVEEQAVDWLEGSDV